MFDWRWWGLGWFIWQARVMMTCFGVDLYDSTVEYSTWLGPM